MAEIESLEIKLKANAQSATKSIDALNTRLRALSTSLSSVNGNRLTGLSQGVSSLANSMQMMKNVGTADFTRLTKNLAKLGSIDAASMNNASASIRRLSNSMAALTTVQFSDSANQIGQLASGIAKLGYKTSTQAITNIPQLANALKQLMTTLSTAPRVSQNIIDMTNALARLSRTGASNIRAAANVSKGFNGISRSAHRASTSVKSLAYYFGKLYANFWIVFRIANKLKDAINLSSALTETQNVVDVTFGNMANKVEDLASTSIQALGMSELTVKQIASRYQAMGSAMGISENAVKRANGFLENQRIVYNKLGDSMADVSVNLTKLTADMASFYNVSQEDVAKDLESVFTGQTRPLRQYGLDLTDATLKEWALKNGLDGNIKSMSQAEKTMLRYQYVLANTVNAQGDFTRTAGTWANQIRILRENFKVLGTTIGQVMINVLKPFVQALNVIMVQINKFAVLISNALGKIFGWKYEETGGGIASDVEEGADAAEDLESGLGGAADKAKKLKQQLQGLDELNVLSSDKDSGSGSGSGNAGGAVGVASNGWVQTQDTMLKSFESEIDNLYDLGKKISTTLTDVMDSINWFAVYQKAANFGKGLAEFLNGLINPDLFSSLGHTIAGAINTALIALDSFANEFDWKNFGNSLASGLNTFFIGFQFSQLTKTIADWFNGIVDAALEFVTTFKWDNLGLNMANGINTFFETFEFGELAKTISETLKGVIKSVTTYWEATDFYLIGQKIGEFIKGLDWKEILADLANAIAVGIDSSFKLIGGLLTEAPLETAMVAAFSLFKFTKVGSTVGEKIVKAIGEKLAQSTAWEAISSTFTTASAGAATFASQLGLVLVGIIGASSIAKDLAECIAYTLGDYDSADAYANFSWDEFFGALNNEDLSGAISELKKDIKNSWGKVELSIVSKWDLTKAKVEGWADDVKAWWGDVKLKTSMAIDQTKESVKEKANEVKQWWGTVEVTIGSKWDDFKTLVTNAKTTIKDTWDQFKLDLGISFDAKKWWNTIKDAWDKAKQALNINIALPDIQKLWSDFKSSFEKKGTVDVKSKLNSNSTGGKIFSKFKSAWDNASSKAKNAIKVSVTSKNANITVGAKLKDGAIQDIKTELEKPVFNAHVGLVPTITSKPPGMPTSDWQKYKALFPGFTAWQNAKGGIYKNGHWRPVQQYAAGGLPSTGEMFVAREAGPELVGTIGGSTAVMNNNQIVDSVSDGVYRAVVSAMQRGGSNVNVYLQGDANKLFKVVQQKGREYARHTGNPVFV